MHDYSGCSFRKNAHVRGIRALPSLVPTGQFLTTCSMQKRTASIQKLDSEKRKEGRGGEGSGGEGGKGRGEEGRGGEWRGGEGNGGEGKGGEGRGGEGRGREGKEDERRKGVQLMTGEAISYLL